MLESRAIIENSSERWCDEVAFSNLPSWIWGPAQRPVFIFLCERVCAGCRGEPGLAGLHKCLLSRYLLLIYYFLSYRRNLTRQLKFVGFIMALFQAHLEVVIFQSVFSSKYYIKSIINKELRFIYWRIFLVTLFILCNNLEEPEMGDNPIIIYICYFANEYLFLTP